MSLLYKVSGLIIFLFKPLLIIPEKKISKYKPSHEETNNLAGFKKWDCTICVAKTKTLISCAVTAQLICVFVFAYADC